MKTPDFWKEKNLLSEILAPLGRLYAAATQLRFRLNIPYKADKPVICIGNLTAGGTGKTPVALSIAQMLKKAGKNPFFLSRGYGGTIHNIVVNKMVHTPSQVGDEPLLLSECAPVVVNPDRAAGAKLAMAHGADCLVMDDGFQNPKLYKDLSFLVFEGAYGIGNGYAIPAGPLRETLAQGVKRAQAAIILGEDKTGIAKQLSLPIFYGKITEEQPKIDNPDILTFAGIGHPEKFYASLKKCGFNVVEKHDFPDHHVYARGELQSLIEQAKKHKLDIYTTSKDYVKIPFALQKHFKVLNITVTWEKPDALKDFILNAFEQRQA